MRVVIIGASRLAMASARTFLGEGHEVVIIEKDQAVIDRLDEEYDCSFYCGDGARPGVLEDMDPDSTDLLLCLADEDTSNVLAAVVAKSMSFDRVVLRLEDDDLLSVCEQLGLDNVIVPDERVAQQLLDFAQGEKDCPQ